MAISRDTARSISSRSSALFSTMMPSRLRKVLDASACLASRIALKMSMSYLVIGPPRLALYSNSATRRFGYGGSSALRPVSGTLKESLVMTPPTEDNHLLRIGLAQIAPVWLDRERTILKVKTYVERASEQGCHLVAFGEALVPGYPFWLELTDGARFNSSLQKSIFAEYAEQAVQPEAGHLDGLCAAAAAHRIAIYLGTVERAADRGAHSLYCSLIFIDPRWLIVSVHRKLMLTYEERLVWSAGDGAGLRTHPLRAFHAGGLNCWENWMPLSRAALYAQGEDLHVAVWPGG